MCSEAKLGTIRKMVNSAIKRQFVNITTALQLGMLTTDWKYISNAAFQERVHRYNFSLYFLLLFIYF